MVSLKVIPKLISALSFIGTSSKGKEEYLKFFKGDS